jgi:hypothetical protein
VVGLGGVEDAGGAPGFAAVGVEEDIGWGEAEAEAGEERPAGGVVNVDADDLDTAVPFLGKPIHDRL